MTDPTCEQVQLSVLAERDGERPLLGAAPVQGHLASCEECPRALEADAAVRAAFQGKARARPPPAPAWPAVARAIERTPRRSGRGLAVAGAAAVVAMQAVALGPGAGFGWAVRLAPVVAIAVLFAALRANPFRLETSLALPPLA